MRLLPVRSDHGHWEKNDSIERRFRDCNESVSAEPEPRGSQTYIALE